jgi:UDP-glucose 4-epimerase
MNILITGGAGFIGSHLADALIKEHHHVTIVDNLSSGSKAFIPSEAEFIEKDIRDESLLSVFESHHFDVVYHEAAQTMVPVSQKDPHYDADENIMGLLRVLESARRTGVKKVIFSSSAAIYGDNPNLPLTEKETPAPTSFYGLTKWMTERYLELYYRHYGLHYTILRYSNVYGPRQGAHGEGGVIYIFAKKLADNQPLTIFGDGGQTRDFISVHDVVRANVAALTRGNEQICNVSTETEVSLNELVKHMTQLSGADVPVSYDQPRSGDIYRSCLSNKKALECLGWKPEESLADGLLQTITYFKNNK